MHVTDTLSIVPGTEKALNKQEWEISWFTKESIPGPHLFLQVVRSADGGSDTMPSAPYHALCSPQDRAAAER